MRVFISHSSVNTRQAEAVRQWLIDRQPSLKREIFLDSDREAGIMPGERWKDALIQAGERCKAVICLLSADWELSPECRAEYRSAENFRKIILCARVEDAAPGPTTQSITSEWQRCDLFPTDKDKNERVPIDGGETVELRRDGLHRLLNGLQRHGIGVPGIGPETFPWPPPDHPERAPYRGWEELDAADAAVFFGRDGEIERGLDMLQRMRNPGSASMLVIQAPSGAGKSAFLRAGLLPRLARDDRRFLPLPVVRPQRAALTGETGLAGAVDGLLSVLDRDKPLPGDIDRACVPEHLDLLKHWLDEARNAAFARLVEPDTAERPPTLVLALDQGEELFADESARERDDFLKIVAGLLERGDEDVPAMLMVVTIRADSFDLLQTEPQLAGVKTESFVDLKPMADANLNKVIEGPADRATASGHPLQLKAQLLEELLKDCATADALPLLALTLERLYRKYGEDGDLTLAEYEQMGKLEKVVQTVIDEILGPDEIRKQANLEILRNAFIPNLATVRLRNGRPRRRLARWSELPAESHELIGKLVDKRLLVKKAPDGEDSSDGDTLVEVALESLLWQWDDLHKWLSEESQDLKVAERTVYMADHWDEGGRRPDDVTLSGTRLTEAEGLAAKGRFFKRYDAAHVDAFLRACRLREDDNAAKEQQRKAKDERTLAEQIRLTKWMTGIALITVICLAGAAWGYYEARWSRQHAEIAQAQAEHRLEENTASRLVAEGESMIAGLRPDGDFRALQQLVTAPQIWKDIDQGGLLNAVAARRDLRKLIQNGDAVTTVVVSPDRSRVVTADVRGRLRQWDAGSGLPAGQDIDTGHGVVWTMAFVGPQVVTGSNDGAVQIWDLSTGRRTPLTVAPDVGHPVRSLAVTPDGRFIVAGSTSGLLRFWDMATGRQDGADVSTGGSELLSLAADEHRLVTGSKDGTVQQWDLQSRSKIGAPIKTDIGEVWAVAYSPRGDQFAAAGQSGKVLLWGTADTGRAPTAMAHSDGVWAIAFSPRGDRLATGSVDDNVRVWDIQSRNEIGAPEPGGGDVKSVAFLGDEIVSAGDDGSVRFWRAPAAGPMAGAPSQEGAGLAFAAERVASAEADGIAQFWDADGADTGQVLDMNAGASSEVVATDGRSMAVATDQGTVQVWNPADGRPVGPVIGAADAQITSLALSGNRVAVYVPADKAIHQWDRVTGLRAGPALAVGGRSVTAMALSPDGQFLATGEDGGLLRVWNTADGEPLTTVPMSADHDVNSSNRRVSSVAFSADGRRIVSGAMGDDSIRVWDTMTGQQIAEMTGHTRDVTSVGFSSDSRYVVSGAFDSTVRIWNADDHNPVGAPLSTGGVGVVRTAFSPDSRLVVAGLRDGTVRVWPGPAAWSEDLCAKLTQNMSDTDWAHWVGPGFAYKAPCQGLDKAPDGGSG